MNTYTVVGSNNAVARRNQEVKDLLRNGSVKRDQWNLIVPDLDRALEKDADVLIRYDNSVNQTNFYVKEVGESARFESISEVGERYAHQLQHALSEGSQSLGDFEYLLSGKNVFVKRKDGKLFSMSKRLWVQLNKYDVLEVINEQ